MENRIVGRRGEDLIAQQGEQIEQGRTNGFAPPFENTLRQPLSKLSKVSSSFIRPLRPVLTGTAQLLPPAAVQRIKKDLFGNQWRVARGVHPSAALRSADIDPVGGAITLPL
jgi:hypothetical protein